MEGWGCCLFGSVFWFLAALSKSLVSLFKSPRNIPTPTIESVPPPELPSPPPVEDFSRFQSIRITGVQNPTALDDYFASSMVDVAYIDEIEDDQVKIITDVGINLADPEDRTWLLDLVQGALDSCGESEAVCEVIIDSLPKEDG